jgi:glycosyltransferase involved in cell wall biosynthesis
MACSNLVIAHDNPFNREVLGDSGLYFATRSELASTVNAVDRNQVEADIRRQKAAQIVKSKYNWDQIASAYFELIESFRKPMRLAD